MRIPILPLLLTLGAASPALAQSTALGGAALDDGGRESLSHGADQTDPIQTGQRICIETQSASGIAPQAAADLCRSMTASIPGSTSEDLSLQAEIRQAHEQADRQSARKTRSQ